MSNHRLTACLIITALLMLLVPLQGALGQEYCEYNMQIQSDGSAYWTITQFSGSNATVETWAGFQQKIFGLVDEVASLTHRNMDIDENSVQINTTLSFESKTTEYSFLWLNFSLIQDSKIVFGDVFQAKDFFSLLFGEASLRVNYPSTYTVQSVYPPPRGEPEHSLKWARTQDLVAGETQVVLTQNGTDKTSTTHSQVGSIAILVLAAGIAVSLLGFYWFRQRQKNSLITPTVPAQFLPIESEEDKILNLLKAQGGVMRQSDITEKTRFSKAKTSQLLSALEGRGILTRYKKGRDKIVTFKEGRKGESK